MKLENYMDIIKEAISYAEKEGIVTAYNWNETLKEKVVVAFGLGKFFRDTYERLFQMVDVKYVCDNDSTKWGKEFYGKKCISPSELSQIENVFVIIVMGDCRSVMKQLQTTPGGVLYLPISVNYIFRIMRRENRVIGWRTHCQRLNMQ